MHNFALFVNAKHRNCVFYIYKKNSPWKSIPEQLVYLPCSHSSRIWAYDSKLEEFLSFFPISNRGTCIYFSCLNRSCRFSLREWGGQVWHTPVSPVLLWRVAGEGRWKEKEEICIERVTITPEKLIDPLSQTDELAEFCQGGEIFKSLSLT